MAESNNLQISKEEISLNNLSFGSGFRKALQIHCSQAGDEVLGLMAGSPVLNTSGPKDTTYLPLIIAGKNQFQLAA
jgi:hypothetical protein